MDKHDHIEEIEHELDFEDDEDEMLEDDGSEHLPVEETTKEKVLELINKKEFSRSDAQYLVKTYYNIQKYRIATNNQIKIKKKDEGKVNPFINWVYNNTYELENKIRVALDIYSMNFEVGRWLRSIHGIGPVMASGLLAYIDMRHRKRACLKTCKKDCQEHFVESEGAMTAPKIWRYAGLDPTMVWEKGKKRPWNAKLKMLCWKIGQSFMKFQNNPNSFYGAYYRERKMYDLAKNEGGFYKELANKQLTTKNFIKETAAKKAYKDGKLPLAHCYAITSRVIVKLFLSHLWEVWYEIEFKKKPSRPWIFAIKGHDEGHYIAPPNWPMKEDK